MVDSETEDLIDATVRNSLDHDVKAHLDEQLKDLQNQKSHYYNRLVESKRTKLQKANKSLD